jgi:ankyrin repeat protein
LYRYSWPGAAAVVRALLAAGADPRTVTAAGTCASHLAAARGDADSLTALLAAGSPPGAVDADKQTILHLVGLHKLNAAVDP